MPISFPLILAAVQSHDKSQWKIGDALIQEIGQAKPGDSDAGFKKFMACAKMLEDQGYRFSAPRLIELRDVAFNFPTSRRRAGIALTAHVYAVTPDNLDQAVDALERIRKPVTGDNVAMVMKAWREKDKDDRADKKFKAGLRKHDAAGRKQRATTTAERAAAEREYKQAAEDEARYSAPPQTRDIESPPPPKVILEVHATCMKIEADAERMTKTLRDNLNELDDILDEIDSSSTNGIIAHHTKLITAAQRIIDKLSRQKTKFRVHHGGAA